jgi:hypothetical protein
LLIEQVGDFYMKLGFSLIASLVVLYGTAFGAGFSVTNYGAQCNGFADDTAGINAAIKAASAKCVSDQSHQMWNQSYIELPTGSTCVINGGLVLDAACVGIVSNGATLNAKGLTAKAALVVTTSQPANPFSENVVPWDHVHLIGPGASTSTIGVLLEAGYVRFTGLNVSNFGVGVEFGNYAFVDRFESPEIMGCTTGVLFPSGLTDAGENITFEGGSVSGCVTGIDNSGGELSINEMSFDGLISASVIDRAGAVRLRDTHVEYFTGLKGSPLELEGGCNAYNFIEMTGGDLEIDSWLPDLQSTVDIRPVGLCGGSGPWVSLNDVFFSGLTPTSQCVRGAGASCVTGSAPVPGTGPTQVTISGTNGAGGGTMGNVDLP